MNFVIGLLAGLLLGVLAGLLNTVISRWALRGKDTGKLLGANILRMVVDFAALGLVYLLRARLPFSWEGAMVGTAIALSGVTLVFAYTYGKKQ